MKTLYEVIGIGGKIEDILLAPPNPDAIIRCGTARIHNLYANHRATGATPDDLQQAASAVEILLTRQPEYQEVIRNSGENGHDQWVQSASADAQAIEDLILIDFSMSGVVNYNVGLLRSLELRADYHKDAFEASADVEFKGLPKEMNGGWMHIAVREELVETLSSVTLRDGFRSHRAWLDRDYNAVDEQAFQILWRNGSFKVGGAPAVASVRALSQKERTRLNTEAKVEMSISLPYWLCATPKEREALIAHELRHLSVDCDEDTKEWKIKSNVPHEVMAFIADMEDTGVQDAMQAQMVAAAICHPDIAQQLEHYGVLAGEQLDLFKTYVDRLSLSSLAVQEQERRELVPLGVSSVTFTSGSKSVTLAAKSGRR